MKINYFREFLVLAELKNYWVASEKLFINQSTLSKHIKSMEEQLGHTLFERTSRKVILSEFGEKMIPIAKKICNLQYEYEKLSYDFSQNENLILNIGSIPVLPYYFITDLLINFQNKFPDVQINIQEADTLILQQWLLEKKCEIAFFRDSTAYVNTIIKDECQFIKIPYCKDYLVAVFPKNHILAGKTNVNLNELSNEKFAFIKESTMPYDFCMRVCQKSGFVPNVVFTSHNIETILDFVAKSDSISLLFFNHTNFFKKSHYEETLTILPILPKITTEIYISYLKDCKLSKYANYFLEYFNNQL